MPRIDPIQLLNCLSVLLSRHGGINSKDEVQRLVNLMTKFSKKLVSKCIYLQILKCTETNLLGMFMGSGGWQLIHMWLTESVTAKNYPLVRELLELLLLSPADIERLKTNNCPKLVKELSKNEDDFVRALATKLVVQWLKIVKGENVTPLGISDITKILSEAQIESDIASDSKSDCKTTDDNITSELKDITIVEEEEPEPEKDVKQKIEDVKQDDETDKLPVLKISLKDGKQVLSQVDDNEDKSSETTDTDLKDKNKSKEKSKDKKSSSSKSSSSSSKHSSKSHSSSSDKHRSSSRSSSSSSRHSSSSKDSKEKDKRSSSKTKSDSKSKKSSDKSSSSSSKSKEERRFDKDRSRDKGKDDKIEKNRESSKTSTSTENSDKSLSNEKPSTNDKSDKKNSTPSIHKLGKIPKLSDVKKEKPSISIEIRKPDEPKPKTVKTFNSKFRKHGLEEEVKPPPSRASVLNNKKPPPILPSSVPVPKRSSPVHIDTPPEKKSKLTETIDKPGAIKLISPKPKPMVLQESDMFMDALNASATNKKEPKKRKRRTSGSKDGNTSMDGSPPHTPSVLNSPNSESKSVPPRFYQDTLDTDENKETSEKIVTTEPDNDKTEEEMEVTTPPHTLTVNGLKGILCYHKRKGHKKSIKWKPDSELEEIKYIPLEKNEHPIKNFDEMKILEITLERDAFQKCRNTSIDDLMEEKTSWRPLIPIDVKGQVQVDYGKNSKEKDIQAIRQKGTLQPLYFHKAMIPDSPLEPELETHPYTEPANIPLEDATGSQENISDYRNMPWPEPKGNAPPQTSNINMPAIFPNTMAQFPNGFPTPQFPGVPGVPGVPGFQGPNMVPGDWQNGMPPHMLNSMPPGAIPPTGIPPGTMPPGLMMPENMMMSPEMFGAPNPMFPGPPDGFNMPQNMFPMDFNGDFLAGAQIPNGPDSFSNQGNFRGAMRGRGAGGHWRGKNPGNWDNSQRGRGGNRGGRKSVCIYFQRKGSCRQGDNCSFLHPGVNGPYN